MHRSEPPEKKDLLIFLGHASEDKPSVRKLCKRLRDDGFDPWLDEERLLPGMDWDLELKKALRASDAILSCFSGKSVGKEGYVQKEYKQAKEYQKEKPEGTIFVIPVRLDECEIPLSYQEFQWVDFPKNYEKLVNALNVRKDQLAKQKNDVEAKSVSSLRKQAMGNSVPLSKVLKSLDPPGGAVKLGYPYYIERIFDEQFKRELAKSGTTVTIRASRQTGKTSLLARGLHGIEKSSKIIHRDLQEIEDPACLADLNTFLRYFAEVIFKELGKDTDIVEKKWKSSLLLGPKDKLTALFNEYIFPEANKQITLAIDEADQLLETPFYQEFFSLLRAWHNKRAFYKQWNKLNIVLVISTEPYFLSNKRNESPFNVGLQINLEDFSQSQVEELNARYGYPIPPQYMDKFFKLLGGHPFLAQRGFYAIIAENWGIKEFLNSAAIDEGPFGDHLFSQWQQLKENHQLLNAFQEIIKKRDCEDALAKNRLLRSGLIKGRGQFYVCRCELYTQYFKDKLK